MIRIGVDLGGTKIEAAGLAADGAVLARARVPTPGTYAGGLRAVASLVAQVESHCGRQGGPIGVGIPGSISPRSGLARNANSTWLNDRPLLEDLQQALNRPVRLRNDANCFVLSEAMDGAGAGYEMVFGVILGTGCGGGVVSAGQLWEGRNGVAGEWGHSPLPWPTRTEWPGEPCWCGRRGCLETWISGPAFEADHLRTCGEALSARDIAARAALGDPDCGASLDRYIDRLARGLAVMVDIIDPDVIVLGGGMSNIAALYGALPAAVARHVFSDGFDTPIRAATHGDSSGVRGAAWLWPIA